MLLEGFWLHKRNPVNLADAPIAEGCPTKCSPLRLVTLDAHLAIQRPLLAKGRRILCALAMLQKRLATTVLQQLTELERTLLNLLVPGLHGLEAVRNPIDLAGD